MTTMLLFWILSIFLAASAARAQAPATPSDAGDCVPLLDAMRIGGHVVFSRIFEASDIQLNATDRYTVFVPEDGEAVLDPGSGISGSRGIVGLFSAYGIDTSTPASIQSSEVFEQVKAFVPYYIVRGAYTVEELRSRSPSNHLATLFDTDSGTCADPDDNSVTKTSDGDIKIEQVEGRVGLTDDSTNTVVQATIVQGDIAACGGTIVHLIRGVLNPCCNDRSADCTPAPLDAKQVDTQVDPLVPVEVGGVGGNGCSSLAGLVAAATAAAALL